MASTGASFSKSGKGKYVSDSPIGSGKGYGQTIGKGVNQFSDARSGESLVEMHYPIRHGLEPLEPPNC